jgi:glycosyltransferase involved in cell wall biosynthesis
VKVALIIPALNEEEAIARVIAGVPRERVDEICVVDNGSTDRTAEVARAAGVSVVREERRGYGYACAAGVAAMSAFDVLVFMDGDGSDDAGQIGALLAPIEAGTADLALGSRVLGARVLGTRTLGALLPHQRLGNALTTTLVRLLYGQRLTDLPPFKAIRRSLLAELDMSEMTYGWTVEMIVKCARRPGCRIVEVPVSAYPRLGGKSKVSGTVKGTLLAAYYLLGTTLKYAWRD